MLSRIEHEESFITSGPGVTLNKLCASYLKHIIIHTCTYSWCKTEAFGYQMKASYFVLLFEPVLEKTNNLGFRPGQTQTKPV